MPFHLRLHQLAYDEYIETYLWYETKRSGLGNEFEKEVESCLNRISQHPQHYTIVIGNFRQAKVLNFPYTIVYEFFPRKKLIHIAAIYHNSRNPKKKYRKRK